MPDSTTHETTHSVGSLKVTVNVDRLHEVDHAIGPLLQGVHKVMCVFRTKTGEQYRPFVCLKITISVF